MRNMRCEIVVSRADRRTRKEMAGKIAVGLVSLDTLGVEVATWYLLSHGVPLETILRVMTAPQRRRR
ncbi:MAG: hypothetical protein V4631_10275 [Pseudomonadota bacterium]